MGKVKGAPATDYRVKFVIDEDARFEECNGESRPLTEAEYVGAEYYKDGAPISYTEYLRYYGNPDRHVFLGCVVEKRCPCCDTWKSTASVWNIDMMDDDPGLRAVTLGKTLTVSEALALPGYFADVAKEELIEAGFTC